MNTKKGDKTKPTRVERSHQLSALIEQLSNRKDKLKVLSNRYSYYRLLILIAGVAVFFFLFFAVSDLASVISFIIFILCLAVVAHFHNKLDVNIKKWEAWIKIKSWHLARLNLDWDNIPKINYSSFENISSIESDLNIIGDKSLHQLINTTTSKEAKSLLRKWLNVSSPRINEIWERQTLVKELVPLIKFRDKLTLHSILSSGSEFDSSDLLEFLKGKEDLPKSFKIIYRTLVVIAPINILLLILNIVTNLPAYWIVLTFVYIILFHLGNKKRDKLVDEGEYLTQELGRIANVFEFIENYKFKKESYLIKLCSTFLKGKESPSYLINKIKSTTGLLRIRKGNPLVWIIIRALFPIDLYFKSRLHKYKTLISLRIREWLEVWYNLEALSSLANFAFLNPEYSFPEILQNKDESMITFAGQQLAHPLIKSDSKIANDYSFNQTGDIVIITGSNMSGKSTFIRTLGVNLLLAYAGSAVDAQSFKISLFRLYTCIGITDSLTNGISYFYAEVKALKKLLDEAKSQGFPVFFLIDEIFRGTNNIERLKGSYAFLKALAQTNVVGAVATHDLELVKLSEEIRGIKNYHFKEEVKDGKMIFDYKLNPGPCPTTNALKIMKLEGLPID